MSKSKTYDAGVKEYSNTYSAPEYALKATDLLGCFKITPQAGISGWTPPGVIQFTNRS